MVSHQVAPRRRTKNGLAIAGFVFGIVGLVTCWVFAGAFTCLPGIIMSALGLRRSRSEGRKGLAMTGLVLSSVGLGAGIILTAVMAVTYKPPPPQDTIESHLGQYLSIKPASGAVDNPYIAGKVVVVNRTDRSIDELSHWYNDNADFDKLRANTPKEVGTVIWLDYTDQAFGSYTDGATAYQSECKLTIIDKAQNIIVGEYTIDGPEPPATKSGSGDVHAARPGSDAIMQYILSLPRQ